MYGRKFYHRIAAWLAFFAVAMLFIAPMISKSLMYMAVEQQSPTVASMNMSDMHHDMTTHAPSEQSPMMHKMLMSSVGQSPMEEIACGYCLLLIHLPFVQFIFALLLWLLLFSVRYIPSIECRYLVILRPWSPQLARAPPVLFSFP